MCVNIFKPLPLNDLVRVIRQLWSFQLVCLPEWLAIEWSFPRRLTLLNQLLLHVHTCWSCFCYVSFMEVIPSRELTYPTLEKGKSPSKVPAGVGYASFQEGMFDFNRQVTTLPWRHTSTRLVPGQLFIENHRQFQNSAVEHPEITKEKSSVLRCKQVGLQNPVETNLPNLSKINVWCKKHGDGHKNCGMEAKTCFFIPK